MSEKVLEDINKGSTRAENSKVYQIPHSQSGQEELGAWLGSILLTGAVQDWSWKNPGLLGYKTQPLLTP